MKVHAINVQVLLITSLSATAWEFKRLVEELNNIYDIRTIFCFTNDARGEQLAETLRGMESPVTSIPKLIWNGNFQNVKTKRLFNANVLSIVFVIQYDRESILEGFKAVLEENLLAKVIFYLPPEMHHNITLKNFSDWLWEERILNSLIIVKDRVFTFNPYPEVSVVEVTSLQSLESVFAAKLVDLHGTGVRVARSVEMSRNVKYLDRKGKIHFGGLFMKTILTFIDKHNGTFVEHRAKPDLSDVNELVDHRKIDFVSMSTMLAVEDGKLSYPLCTSTTCVLLPYQKEIPRVFYLMLPFQMSGWLLFGAGVLLLLFVVAITEHLYGTSSGSVCQESAFRVWRILTQQIHFRAALEANQWIMIIHLLAMLQFMLLLSLYQSGLSSFYTKSIPAKQIDTAEALAKTSYKILFPPVELTFLRQLRILPENVLEHFRADDTLINSNLNQMDPKFGYLPPSEYKHFLKEMEDRPSTKVFHFTKICSRPIQLGIINAKDSPFEDIMNDVIFRLTDAGLMFKWQKDVFYELKQVGFMRIDVPSQSPLRPLKFEELYFVWILYAVFIVLCIVTFCVERVTKKRVFC